MSEINYITPRGYKTLVDELEHLAKVERPEVTKVVQWAASLGDRSENADYQYGKKRLREIDRRIRFLTKRLDIAQVVDPSRQSGEKIVFGATVTVEGEDGEERIFHLVGVDEVDTSKNKISWKSPIGGELLGKEVGDTARVRTPSGIKEYEILEIEFKELE